MRDQSGNAFYSLLVIQNNLAYPPIPSPTQTRISQTPKRQQGLEPFQILWNINPLSLSLLQQPPPLLPQILQMLNRFIQHYSLTPSLILLQSRNHIRQLVKPLPNRLSSFLFLHPPISIHSEVLFRVGGVGEEADRRDMICSFFLAGEEFPRRFL
jgi:hypothetical protein